MSNNSKNPAATASETTLQTAPPEAYADFIRIYMKWMGMDPKHIKYLEVEKPGITPYEYGEEAGAELYELIRNGLIFAAKRHNTYGNITPEFPQYGPFGKTGSMLYGQEFDEYVNQTWYNFLGRLKNPDKFMSYFQKKFEEEVKNDVGEYYKKCQLKFIEMRDNFYNMVVKEWESAYEEMDDDDEFADYLEKEKVKREKEYKRMKKAFEAEAQIVYPQLRTLVQRTAANTIEHARKGRIKVNKHFINFSDCEDGGTVPFNEEDINAGGRVTEAVLAINDIIERTHIALDKQNKIILVFMLLGFTNVEISKALSVSESTVSRRLKKIRTMLAQALEI